MIVDQEYKAHLKNLQPAEAPKSRIKIQTEVAMAKLNKESEEVKAEVEEYRQHSKDEADTEKWGPEKKLDVYQA